MGTLRVIGDGMVEKARQVKQGDLLRRVGTVFMLAESRRAVCRRSASTVRRGEGPGQPVLPTPIRPAPATAAITAFLPILRSLG